jgi:hypothetical protein
VSWPANYDFSSVFPVYLWSLVFPWQFSRGFLVLLVVSLVFCGFFLGSNFVHILNYVLIQNLFIYKFVQIQFLFTYKIFSNSENVQIRISFICITCSNSKNVQIRISFIYKFFFRYKNCSNLNFVHMRNFSNSNFFLFLKLFRSEKYFGLKTTEKKKTKRSPLPIIGPDYCCP